MREAQQARFFRVSTAQWRWTLPADRVAAIATGIAENDPAEETQRSNDERLRSRVANFPDHAILALDAHGRVVTWNSGAQRLNGYSDREIVGRHFSIFYSQLDRELFHPARDLRRAVLEDGHAEEGWSIRKDGSRFWASVIISPVRGIDGMIRGFDTLTRDCTERCKLDEHLQAQRNELAASVAKSVLALREVHHRVKNNLQVISSLISMQARSMKDEPSRTAFQDCRRRVDVLAVVHDTLYEAGDGARVPFPAYAEGLARDVFEGAGAVPRGLSLELELEDVALAANQAVPCGLILNELLVNAIKHAFPHGRVGRVGIQYHRKTAHEVLLRVWDDGIGMRRMDLDGHASGRRRCLGMTLIHALVAQLGGRLELSAARGTALEITFPSATPRLERTASAAGDRRDVTAS